METVWRLSRMYDVYAGIHLFGKQAQTRRFFADRAKTHHPERTDDTLCYKPLPEPAMEVHHRTPHRHWTGQCQNDKRSHSARGFWNGLGYHFLIDNGTLGKGDGQIEMSPRWIMAAMRRPLQSRRNERKSDWNLTGRKLQL